jgi:hypothetical protein
MKEAKTVLLRLTVYSFSMSKPVDSDGEKEHANVSRSGQKEFEGMCSTKDSTIHQQHLNMI